MLDLVRALSLEHAFDIMEYLAAHPGANASTISHVLGVHIVTVQHVLEALEAEGAVSSVTSRGSVGRPAKVYRYHGGVYTIDLDQLLDLYAHRAQRVRDAGNPAISYSYDLDHEVITSVLVGGRSGIRVAVEPHMRHLFWLVPPPNSIGAQIQELAEQAHVPQVSAVQFLWHMKELGAVEVLG